MKDIDFIDDAINNLIIARPETNSSELVQFKNNVETIEVRQKRYLTKKYRLALKLSALLDLQELAETHPEWGAKDVLFDIMKDYYSDFPAELVLEMSHYIVTEWEKIQASKKELVH
jgi:hypothetical protein